MAPIAIKGAGDGRTVIDAAQALRIREYDLFRAAFRQWWGREADDKTLERVFVASMFHQVVPPWVRHFCRRVLEMRRQDRLDPVALGVAGFRRVERPPPLGRLYVALTSVAALILYLMILTTTYNPGASAPMGCSGGSGLKFFADIAHAFADKPPPDCGTPGESR
ncbi:MAG: hypothetical protein QF450_08465 [Rhodospirillales bacterium]|nr:hypothetical protein [Rhodospirillales bacterium]HJO72319.1 hypothetical protein [Rhodospirillales bacterium]